MKTLLAASLLLCSCATIDHDLEALVHDPNVASSIAGLVSAAGTYLDSAIERAEDHAVRIMVEDPNGMADDLHAATELRKVKAQLDALDPNVPMPITRFVRPEP